LVQALGDKHNDVQRAARGALLEAAKHVNLRPRVLDALVRALKHRDLRTYHSAKLLGDIGDPRAVDALVRGLEEGRWSQVEVQALGRIGGPRAVDALLRLLKHEDKDARWEAVQALGRARDPRAVLPLVQALKDKDYHVQVRAAASLGEVGDPRAVDALLVTFKAESGNLQRAAANALCKIQPEWRHSEAGRSWTDLKTLDEVAYTTAEERREKEALVREALDRVAAIGELGIRMLLERLFKELQLEGSRLFVPYTPDEQYYYQYEFTVGPGRHLSEWARKLCVLEALGRARATAAVPSLVALLEAWSMTETDYVYGVLHPAVARALGEIGDKSAVEPLRRVLQNPEIYGDTQAAIYEALERLEGQKPEDPDLIVIQAHALYQSGASPSEVLGVLEQVDSQKFDPLRPINKYYLWYLRGECYLKSKNKAKAVECYETSIQYFDDKWRSWGRRPEALSRLKELK